MNEAGWGRPTREGYYVALDEKGGRALIKLTKNLGSPTLYERRKGGAVPVSSAKYYGPIPDFDAGTPLAVVSPGGLVGETLDGI